jgi:acyl-CoA synthetase (AMP-forming)/AMP-acid ligase II
MPAEHSVGPTSSASFLCLPYLLEHQAKRTPDAPAILAPGRAAVTYSRLYRHIDKMGRELRAMGIGRCDRIAVVLPNGPEMAVAILSVAASAVCAPMNPADGSEELNRYFAELQPRALITQPGIESPARRAALSHGVHVVEISTAEGAEAGLFTFTGRQRTRPSEDPVSPDDVALLFLTSGTTSRPKIVPLTHANICTSAYSAGAALALTEADRCLNILPLFHGHGLIGNVVTSLAAGASVVCTPGCDAYSFFGWLTTFKPTWYSAVPAMHQAILAQAQCHREPAADHRLRFVRSGSAPLPPRIFAELEETFETSVIEVYGMAEAASSLVTCNPLPPRRRKVGSVGVPVSLDVAIMDESGTLLPQGQTGQVVIRGASVMSGYQGDPVANRTAFVGDWFTTGDQGFFDEDGYLFLVGRSQEIINRGGDKVAPREVDEVLLEHPAVAEAVTFAVPHPTLGEDVASAIVLRQPIEVAPHEIRRFVSGRVADFKVPRKVLIVSELPKGPTGKVQRVGLASKFGLASPKDMPRTFVAPRTPLEQLLAQSWAEILRLEQVGVHDDFFTLGGDSLSVAHVVARVYEIMRVEIDVSRFFEAPTVAALAHHLEGLAPTGQAERLSSTIVRISRQEEVPASITQERLWKLHQLLPGMPFFNLLYTLRLTTPCDLAVLEQSLNEIVRRHEILRTSFNVVDGRHVQVIASELPVHLRFDDLQALPESKRDTAGHELIQEEVLHCFDLEHGPLFRARLIRLAELEHLLVITMHQIIGDGWSAGVLANELTALYDAFSAGEAPPLASLSIQYADFAHWQRRWQSRPETVAQLEFWRQQLRNPLSVIELATGRPRRTIDDLLTARRTVRIPASLSEATKRFSHQEGGTLFMALVAALKTLLHRYLGQEDVRVATLVANRNRPGTGGLIGPLANTVILRTDLSGDPSRQEVMRRVRSTTLAAFANQDLPFEVLAETLERERAVKPARLAQVMIQLQNATLRPTGNSGHALSFEDANLDVLVPLVTATTFDLILMLHESAHGLMGSCVYKPHLYDANAIDCLLRDFRSVLEQIVAQPEQPISAIRVSTQRETSNSPLPA